jgi:hypothetical protein
MLERKREELTVASTARSRRYWNPRARWFWRFSMVMEYTTAFRRSRRVQKHGRRS